MNTNVFLKSIPVLLGTGLILTSCVSGRMANREPDRLFREQRYDEAAARLEAGLKKEGTGNDQLLYLMDLGLALHTVGRYEESNKFLLEADKIAEIKDYTSLAAEASTLLVSENIKHYKGEDFEKVLINTYLAMNFSALGNTEEALVEAKRVNHKLHLMITDGQRKYKQNAFAYYLSGILYESEGEFDDAYIDYKMTFDLAADYPGLGQALWRVAKIAKFDEDLKKWENEFSLSADDKEQAMLLGPRSQYGEIVVLYENGISPIKRPHPAWHAIPKFFPRYNPVFSASVEVDGKDRGRTWMLHNIEQTAIENLDEKYAGILAKKIAGAVAKEVVGDQIAKQTNNELLGFVAKVVMHVADQADVRSWNLLPRDLQVARIAVGPGLHEVKVIPEGDRARAVERKVQIATGKKVFVNFRYVP